jgi:hypothetical protein
VVHFVHRDQLTEGLSPPRSCPCRAHGADVDGSPVVVVGNRYVGFAADAASTTPVTTVVAWETIERANPDWRIAALEEALMRRFERDAPAPPARPKTSSSGSIILEPPAPIAGRDVLVVADAGVPFWKMGRLLFTAESVGARTTLGVWDGKRLRRGPTPGWRGDGSAACVPLTLRERTSGAGVELGRNSIAVAVSGAACVAGADHAEALRAVVKKAGQKLCVDAKVLVDDDVLWQPIVDDTRVLAEHGLSLVLRVPGLSTPSSCVPFEVALKSAEPLKAVAPGASVGLGPGRGMGGVPSTIVFDGALSRADISAVVSASLPAIRECYDAELARDPKLEGKLSMSWTIGPDGSTSKTKAAENTFQTKAGAAVETCVTGIVAKMKFPHPKGGGNVQVTYPFVFANSPPLPRGGL